MNSPDPTEIRIPLSRGKLFLLFLGAIAFVGVAIGLWLIAEAQPCYYSLYVKGVAGVGIAFFCPCAVALGFKLFDRKPGLVLDAKGIVDNSTAVAVGRVPWQDITGIRVTTIAGQRFLTLEVVTPRLYMAHGNTMKRLLQRMNFRQTGSPINISANTLRISFEELLRLLSDCIHQTDSNR